jgi:hypothetical protein
LFYIWTAPDTFSSTATTVLNPATLVSTFNPQYSGGVITGPDTAFYGGSLLKFQVYSPYSALISSWPAPDYLSTATYQSSASIPWDATGYGQGAL